MSMPEPAPKALVRLALEELAVVVTMVQPYRNSVFETGSCFRIEGTSRNLSRRALDLAEIAEQG
jgi:hypothetical protein